MTIAAFQEPRPRRQRDAEQCAKSGYQAGDLSEADDAARPTSKQLGQPVISPPDVQPRDRHDAHNRDDLREAMREGWLRDHRGDRMDASGPLS